MDCPECPTTGPSSPEQSRILAPGALVVERMSRSESERRVMTEAFHDHFLRVDSTRIPGTEQEVPWDNLLTLVNRVKAADHPDRGVVFHYGLKDGAFKLGLSAVPLEPQGAGAPTTFRYDHQVVKVYPVIGNEIKTNDMIYAQWFGSRTLGGPLLTGTYFHATTPSIQVRRTDAMPAVWVPVLHGTDVEHEVMPFERELDRLHRDNRPPSDDYDEFVVITCASVYDAALTPPSYRHRLILHMRYRLKSDHTLYVDALSDRPSPDNDLTPFHMRAADLGNLCPPNGNCGVYILQRSFL